MRVNYQFSDKVVQHFFDFDYHDRGMLKWGGFFLSDHTKALKRLALAEREIQPKPEQLPAEIASRLEKGWCKQCLIYIQQKVVQNGTYLPDVVGVVVGYDEANIFLKIGQSTQTVAVMDIRNVSFRP
ncbi:hypothetical protein [Loigolactobacillus backii]|uniref:Uncharacterized protein n=1 Tax=Loigolactobacillus backii TaxID=375175 RepID=A0A192H0G0_9LACO|nr:hypothetical protein [Loigolactobacillus backii]ANK60706.1 hypothetical protein AYR52_10870 [Loigolactobacillus backii]ANK61727.1 hypothetical protein AYR53_02460 [Loigolactobacillus backii]ANK65659.1 hypothetical protein AYR54_10670 [Loigolactobacillus backii]ANK68136.1 hypothetical protein AYR55_10825 [Loigolactobacillus backii]ANK69077.1 hypothetical protein AYR56_02260 [Loigolactobacillus backii]